MTKCDDYTLSRCVNINKLKCWLPVLYIALHIIFVSHKAMFSFQNFFQEYWGK